MALSNSQRDFWRSWFRAKIAEKITAYREKHAKAIEKAEAEARKQYAEERGIAELLKRCEIARKEARASETYAISLEKELSAKIDTHIYGGNTQEIITRLALPYVRKSQNPALVGLRAIEAEGNDIEAKLMLATSPIQLKQAIAQVAAHLGVELPEV